MGRRPADHGLDRANGRGLTPGPGALHRTVSPGRWSPSSDWCGASRPAAPPRPSRLLRPAMARQRRSSVTPALREQPWSRWPSSARILVPPSGRPASWPAVPRWHRPSRRRWHPVRRSGQPPSADVRDDALGQSPRPRRHRASCPMVPSHLSRPQRHQPRSRRPEPSATMAGAWLEPGPTVPSRERSMRIPTSPTAASARLPVEATASAQPAREASPRARVGRRSTAHSMSAVAAAPSDRLGRTPDRHGVARAGGSGRSRRGSD
jgi:hypothetical protein